MTHGYLNRLGEELNWNVLLRSGLTRLEAVATDWIFGTAPVVPPVTGAGWWKKSRPWVPDERELILRRKWEEEARRRMLEAAWIMDEEEFILIGG